MNPARKIGYSFLGLLAGDVALLVYFVWMTRAWEPNHWQLLDIFVLYMFFTFPGWIVVGVPAVLLMDVQFIKRLHRALVLLVGAALGALAQFLIFLFLGLLHHRNLALLRWNVVAWYWMLAMLVSTVAFAVYCALVRRTSPVQ